MVAFEVVSAISSHGDPMDSLFQRAKQNHMYQDVVEQMQTAIAEGRMCPGELLPSNQELCEIFRTNEDTLHEALRILEQKGLIETRLEEGGGVFVKDANAELMAENLAMLIRSYTISLEHLTEFRETVEGTVAGLAARRSTASDNQKMAKLIEEAALCMEKGLDGWNSLVQIDEKIHMEIANIAGNPLFTFVLRSIHDSIHRYYDKFLIIGETEMDENFQDLHLIVEAIADRDAERAQHYAAEHVRRFSRYMEQKKRSTPNI